MHNGFQAAKGNPQGFVEEQKVKFLNVPRIEMQLESNRVRVYTLIKNVTNDISFAFSVDDKSRLTFLL